MRILRHARRTPPHWRGGVYAIGNFDGVHRGHQAVIAAAAVRAEELRAPLGVLFFHPHPVRYFRPDEPVFQLMSFRAKAHKLQELGVDVIAALAFGRDMAERSAQSFVCDVLLKGLGACHVVVGYDFVFGHGRAGDRAVLDYMGLMEGLGVTVIEPVAHGGDVCSSTRIRAALREGRPGEAAAMLGHWWSVEGHVAAGDRRARTFGYPTANLPLEGYAIPARGVYAVHVRIEDGPHAGRHAERHDSPHDGVAYIGRRPTFGGGSVLLEAHLFDFDGDLYGAHLAVDLVEFIRPDRRFDSADSLAAQVARDAEQARSLLAGHPRRVE